MNSVDSIQSKVESNIETDSESGATSYTDTTSFLNPTLNSDHSTPSLDESSQENVEEPPFVPSSPPPSPSPSPSPSPPPSPLPSPPPSPRSPPLERRPASPLPGSPLAKLREDIRHIVPMRLKEPKERATVGDSTKFTDVLYTCVGHLGQNRQVFCDTLRHVTEEDIEAFRTEQPEASQDLEKAMASGLETLHDNHRALGLYMAMLVQGIDLAHMAHGPLAKGKAGEVASRLGAIMKQSLRVHEERRKLQPPVWSVVVMGILGVLIIAAIVYIILQFHPPSKHAGPKKSSK